MAEVREIITEWNGPDGQALNIMYALADQPVAAQRSALATFMAVSAGKANNLYSFRVRTEGRVLEVGTGALTGVWNEAVSRTGVGAQASAPLPDATQVLVRWTSSAIVNNRLLRGRTFLPGWTVAATANGEVAPSDLTAITAGAATFVTAATGFVIWHRPTGAGSDGAVGIITGSSAWAEFAVQRRRRS